VKRLDPISRTRSAGTAALSIARRAAKNRRTAEEGYLHCGPNGAGHFVKMIHNGIEYGLMAAYAEGFNILKHANVGNSIARQTPKPRRCVSLNIINTISISLMWRKSGGAEALWRRGFST